MAKELGDLIVRLSLDSSRFENSLEKFEAQMTKVQASCMSAATGLTSFKKVTEKLPPMRSEAAYLFFGGDYTVPHASA